MKSVSIYELYEIYQEHPTVTTDSRALSPGCLFFALRGERFDGNAFALQALSLGAAYAIVDDATLGEHPGLLLVEDTLLALQELAALHRVKCATPIIAITGTNGKTTTKELSAAVLSRTYRLHYTEGNLNNHIGVPLTLLKLRPEHTLALIEMGASRPGDIEELCQIAQPNYGLITNIGMAHLEGFGSIEGVEATKGELYEWLRAHDGKVIRREEDPRLARLGRGLPTVSYGNSPEAVVLGRVLDDADSMYLSLEWSAEAIGIAPRVQATQLVGRYNVDNVLAAISLGLFFDVPTEEISDAIATYKPSNSRSQLIQSDRNVIVADAYNANPSSMRSAIDNFLSLATDRPRLIILGDMNELGAESQAAHQALLSLLISHGQAVGELLFCGPQWQAVAGETHRCFSHVDDLAEYLTREQPTGRLILVKGSNGIKLGQIVPLL